MVNLYSGHPPSVGDIIPVLLKAKQSILQIHLQVTSFKYNNPETSLALKFLYRTVRTYTINSLF